MMNHMKDKNPSTELTYGTEGLGDLFESITAGFTNPFKGKTVAEFTNSLFGTIPVTKLDSKLIRMMNKTDLKHLLERKIERPAYLKVQFATYIDTLTELFEEYGSHTAEIIQPAVEWIEAVISSPNGDSKLLNVSRMQRSTHGNRPKGIVDTAKNITVMSSMFLKDNTVSVNQSNVCQFIDMFHTIAAFERSATKLAKLEDLISNYDAERVLVLETKLMKAVKYYSDNVSDFNVPKDSLKVFSEALRTISKELEFIAAIIMQVKTAAAIFDRNQDQLKDEIK